MMATPWVQQWMDLTKAVFDSSFYAVAAMQDQAGHLWSAGVEQSRWMTEEGARTLDAWAAACRRSRSTLKLAVDAGYDQLRAQTG